MEKAAEVYNKLKLRFVGKGEVAAKPKTEHKEPGDNEETQNTGKHPSVCPLWASVLSPLFVSHLIVCIFLDSTPVNGDSDQKKEDMEVEEKPKSPAQEENNDEMASSPNR